MTTVRLPLRSRLPSGLPQAVLYTRAETWDRLPTRVRERLERAVHEYRQRLDPWVRSHEDTAEWVRATRRHTLAWTRTDGVVWVGPIARGGELFEELLHLAPRHLFTALDPITDTNFVPSRPQVILALDATLYTSLKLDQRQSLQSPLKGHDAAWAIEGDRAETVPMEKHGALHRALLRAVRAAGLWPLLQQRDPAAPRSRDDQAEDATEEQAA